MKENIILFMIALIIILIICLIAYFNMELSQVILMIFGWLFLFGKSEKISKWLLKK